MRLVDRFRFAALALVIVATIAFCVAVQSVPLFLVAAPLVVLSWYVTEGPRGKVLPTVVQNVLLAGLLIWAALSWARLTDLSDSMTLLGQAVLGLLLVKLYGRKTPRDYAQILALSAVLVMTGTLQTVEFAFAVLVFAYVAMALWTVLLFQMWAARERARERRERVVEVVRAGPGGGARAALIPPVQAVAGRRLVGNFRALTAVALALGLVLSAFVFIAFPRELAELARRDARFGVRRTGFSEEVRLFQNDRISESEREVFAVTWRDRRGEAQRFSDPLYLRGAVLDRYDPAEGRWTRPRGRAAWRGIPTIASENETRFAPLTALPVDERIQTYTQEVEMRSLASDVVFAVAAPIAVASPQARTFEFDAATLLLREARVGRIGRLGGYTVKTQPFASEATFAALEGDADPPQPEDAIRFPVDGVRAVAERAIADMAPEDVPTPEAIAADPSLRWVRNRMFARSIADWLRSSRFSYTTDLGPFVRIRDEDPILSFLTRYRFGHCEYFASALVAMCQSIGIESRLVTGYIAVEYDESLEQYVVRESNAHAWAEVRVGQHGWMTLDATPPSTLAAFNERRRSWADSFRWIYDRVEFLWNSQVIGFDSSTQATIAERMGGAWQRSLRDAATAAQERLRQLNDYFRFGPAGTIWLGLVAFAGVLAIQAILGLRRRRQRLRAAVGGEAKPLPWRSLRPLGFWLDALDTLARHRLAKPEARSPLAHVEALRAERPEAGEAFATIVEAFYRIRFAGDPPLPERATAELVRRLDAALRGSP